MLARTDVAAYAITVDSGNVYWTLGAVAPAANVGSWPVAMKCAKGACDAPTVLAYATDVGFREGDGELPHEIAVDEANVYWTSSASPSATIVSCGVGGCNLTPSTVVTAAGAISNLSRAGQSFFWLGGDATSRVSTCTAGACASTTSELGDGSAPLSLAHDDAHVYWSTLHSILRCPLSHCDAPEVIATVDDAQALALDATYVYFRGLDGIVRAPKDGSAPMETIVPASAGVADDIATDGKDVYFVTSGHVARCAVTGCASATRLDEAADGDEDAYANRLALDDANVYWTTGRTYTGMSTSSWKHAAGSVMMRAK